MPPRRALVLLGLLGALHAGCSRPPPDAYVGGGARQGAAALGANAAGEACTQQAAGADREDIFCGTWQQPSAHLRRGEAAGGAGGLSALTQGGPWRAGLEARFQCAPPRATTILGDVPAEVLDCLRRVGGWPQVAIAAEFGGTVYYADGVLPALPVMERGLGVMAGRLQPGETARPSGADALFAARLATQSFSAGDIGQYEALMSAGSTANLAENFAAAEQAFRAALALQRKALGPADPNTVTALTHLALQVSNQGRFAEADALFAEAGRLAAKAADDTARPRLLHYAALNLLNQRKDAEALAMLRQAEAAYAALLPPETDRPADHAPVLARTASGAAADLPSGDRTLIDPTQRTALMGVIETRRYSAIALAKLGRPADSAAALAAANRLAAAHDLRAPVLTARLQRTAATAAAARGETDAVLPALSRSAADFRAALPGARPIAETELLRAAELVRQGRIADAIGLCRDAQALLRRLHAGLRPTLLQSCLLAYRDAAAADPAGSQPLLAEMFEMAQLGRMSVTARQIALAAARLGENARDPKVGAAIRRRQDAERELAALYRARDVVAQQQQGGERVSAQAAELDRQIGAAQATLTDADQALQEAAPNYGQLVQDAASAADVLRLLGPGEAFAAISLAGDAGWTFLLRDGRVAVAPIPGGLPRIAELVKRVRAGTQQTARGLPPFDTAAAQALYAETLGQVPLAGTTNLVVAPAGPLLALPFGVLLTGPGDPARLAQAPWLIRQMTVAHVPAAGNFVALRRIATGSRATRPWFGFGDFRPVTLAQASRSFPGESCAGSARLFAGLARLPFSIRELQAARLLVGGAPGDELLGPAFTSDAVRQANLQDVRILHFAAHALLPEELRCQAEPAIVTSTPPQAPTASGALLTASDVTGLKLDADTVILSACNSGGPGGGTAGESLSGLARAFFYAGARSMLVTHWSVNDQAAAFLVADTLRRARAGEGGGIAGALRNAELGMLDEAGKTQPAEVAHPFYWAPFALIGEGRVRPAAEASVSPERRAGL